MAWIESHQEVANHPKTRKLARRLNIPIPQAVGHLHVLWHWALTHAFDGDLSGYDFEDIAVGAMWDGDADEFVKALLEAKGRSGAGFLEQAGERIFLHDWQTYTAHLRARRESAQKANHIRWHSDRNVTDSACEWCRTPDGIEPESERSQDGTDAESTVPEPDLTEQNLKPMPDLNFEAFWKSYPPRPNGSKGSKKKALGVWSRLSILKREQAVCNLTAYVKSAGSYTRDAERYLRDEMWDGLETPPDKPDGEGSFYINDLTDEQRERYFRGLPI